MIDAFTLPETVEEDIDIYDALGLNTPVSTDQSTTETYDPLAAFMDDDEEDDFAAQTSAHDMFAPSPVVTNETVESLLATLARDLLDHERLAASLAGGRVDMTSLKVQRDRDAYHLSLIVDMGGEQIKPFATVVAVEDAWKPMAAPRGLHAHWKPVYDSLCKALTDALSQQGRPSTL